MELLAVFLIVFLVGVQVGQWSASWAIYYAIAKLLEVLMTGQEKYLVYQLQDEIVDGDNHK